MTEPLLLCLMRGNNPILFAIFFLTKEYRAQADEGGREIVIGKQLHAAAAKPSAGCLRSSPHCPRVVRGKRPSRKIPNKSRKQKSSDRSSDARALFTTPTRQAAENYRSRSPVPVPGNRPDAKYTPLLTAPFSSERSNSTEPRMSSEVVDSSTPKTPAERALGKTKDGRGKKRGNICSFFPSVCKQNMLT